MKDNRPTARRLSRPTSPRGGCPDEDTKAPRRALQGAELRSVAPRPLEALTNRRTLAEIASEYAVHPNQVSTWKKQALEGLPSLFAHKPDRERREAEELQAELYRQIGQLKVELDWLEKKVGRVG